MDSSSSAGDHSEVAAILAMAARRSGSERSRHRAKALARLSATCSGADNPPDFAAAARWYREVALHRRRQISRLLRSSRALDFGGLEFRDRQRASSRLRDARASHQPDAIAGGAHRAEILGENR